jgi:hypothetical protein
MKKKKSPIILCLSKLEGKKNVIDFCFNENIKNFL